MEIEFIPVVSQEQIKTLASMAEMVWNEWFGHLLSQGQIDYMIEKFQSFNALKLQIQEEGYEYFFLNVNGTNVGYTGIHVEEKEKKIFLSKIYILKSFRGKKYSNETFEYLEHICQGKGLKSIWLTVNKYNENAIAVYIKKGFKNVRSQVTDIGSGYVMDDYVMEKVVS